MTMQRRKFMQCGAVAMTTAMTGRLAMMRDTPAQDTKAQDTKVPYPAVDTDDVAALMRVLFIEGGHDYEEAAMHEMLARLPGMKVTRMEFSQAQPLLKPGPDGVRKDYDALLFYDSCHEVNVTPEQQEAYVKMLEEGGLGVVIWHHAILPHYADDYAIIGGRYHTRPEHFRGHDVPASTWEEGVDFDVQIAAPNHPIVKGMEPFTLHDEIYGGMSVDPGVDVLLTTNHPHASPQLLWTKPLGKTRVVCLIPGHGSDSWNHPVFAPLLVRCLRWSRYGKID